MFFIILGIVAAAIVFYFIKLRQIAELPLEKSVVPGAKPSQPSLVQKSKQTSEHLNSTSKSPSSVQVITVGANKNNEKEVRDISSPIPAEEPVPDPESNLTPPHPAETPEQTPLSPVPEPSQTPTHDVDTPQLPAADEQSSKDVSTARSPEPSLNIKAGSPTKDVETARLPTPEAVITPKNTPTKSTPTFDEAKPIENEEMVKITDQYDLGSAAIAEANIKQDGEPVITPTQKLDALTSPDLVADPAHPEKKKHKKKKHHRGDKNSEDGGEKKKKRSKKSKDKKKKKQQ